MGDVVNFEEWFKQQDFYENMMFVHGDRLFDNDDGVYRLLPVRIAHEAWLYRGKKTNNLEGSLQDEPCSHFSTTMLFNGKAKCFGCKAIVDAKRQIVSEAHLNESLKLNNLG